MLETKSMHGIIVLNTRRCHLKLHVTIEKDKAGYYVAEVPALPGCLSQGKTYDEALVNIKEAIAGWFEVMEAKASPQSSQLVEVTV